MELNTGTYISGIGHGTLIVWALVGGFFLRADDPLPLQSTEVSLLSGEEFAALSQPEESPSVLSENPDPVPPSIQEDTPSLKPIADATPEMPEPVEVVQPEPETVPEQPQPEPSPQADVTDDAPDVLQPPAQDSAALVTPKPDVTPKPTPAPRIAPVPAAEPAPDIEIADTVTPEVVPDDTADKPVEEKPATAPQEAATEIVTEAETPAAAPNTSPRPKNRPKPPPKVVQAREPDRPQTDAIDDAVAAAVADSSNDALPTPSGPPLTRGEKDALRVSVSACWNLGSSSSDALSTTVVVKVRMSQSGKPENISLLSSNGPNENSTRIAFDAARRAILRCQKTGYNLPSDKYSQWQNIEMTFNPEKMRIK